MCRILDELQIQKQNIKKRIKNSETEKNIEEINALWYRYSITYSVE